MLLRSSNHDLHTNTLDVPMHVQAERNDILTIYCIHELLLIRYRSEFEQSLDQKVSVLIAPEPTE